MELHQRGRTGPIYVHFYDIAGKRKRLSTGCTDEAEAKLKAPAMIVEHNRKVSLDGPLGDAPGEATGDDVSLAHCLKTAWLGLWKDQKSSKEKKALIGKITREIGHWPRRKITHDALRDHLNSLTVGTKFPKPLANATKNRYVSAISTALEYTFREDHSYRVPKMPGWTENNVKERYVTEEEEKVLLKWFAEHTAPAMKERMYLWNLVILLLDTGLRCTEALEVFTRDRYVVDKEGDYHIHLPHGDTKSGRGRLVPLTSRAKMAAEAMLDSPIHGTWTSQNAGRAFKTIVDRLKMHGVTMHILRHTTASRLIQAGEEIYTVSQFLGHSSVEVTKRYAHLAPQNLKGAMKRLEKVAVPDVPPPTDGYPQGDAQPPFSGTENRVKLYAIK